MDVNVWIYPRLIHIDESNGGCRVDISYLTVLWPHFRFICLFPLYKVVRMFKRADRVERRDITEQTNDKNLYEQRRFLRVNFFPLDQSFSIITIFILSPNVYGH